MIKRNLAILGLATLLSACGFQLRGTQVADFALQEIELQARDSYSETARQLEQLLENSGVNVHPGAPFTLDLVNEQTQRRAASYTSAARTAEYQLTTELTYQIRGSRERVLLEDRLQVQKIYVHDGNNLAGSEQEAQQLRTEIRRELIQQLAQRLRRLTPAELERLEEAAERREREDALRLRERDVEPDPAPLQSWPQ